MKAKAIVAYIVCDDEIKDLKILVEVTATAIVAVSELSDNNYQQ